MRKEVRMGEIAAVEGQHELVASGIGSCLVVTLYDPERKIGALSHAILPFRGPRVLTCFH